MNLAWVVSLLRAIGWKGLLAIGFAGMALYQMALADRYQRQAAINAASMEILAKRLARQNREVERAQAAVAQAASDMAAVQNNSALWSDAVVTVKGALTACNAENTRLNEDNRAARATAQAAAARASRDITGAADRFKRATPQCVVALKQMEVSCAGQF